MRYFAQIRLLGVGLLAVAATLVAVSTAGAATTQLLTNGSFETGDFTGWTVNSTTGCQTWQVWSSPAAPCFIGSWPGFPTSLSAVDGTDFASVTWDGAADSNPELSQTVSIPSNTTDTLAWSDNASWDIFDPASAPRVESVEIVGGSPAAVLQTFTIQSLTPGITGTTDWVARSLDLSAYAGQTVTIVFHLSVPETFTGPAVFAIDGVTLNSTPNLPTSKDQCKKGGWQNFGGQFKNQGDCVSFVASGGKNPPSGG